MGEFGVTAEHAEISDRCRKTWGDREALTRAFSKVREAYESALEGRKDQEGVKYHVVLYVEPPTKSLDKGVGSG